MEEFFSTPRQYVSNTVRVGTACVNVNEVNVRSSPSVKFHNSFVILVSAILKSLLSQTQDKPKLPSVVQACAAHSRDQKNALKGLSNLTQWQSGSRFMMWNLCHAGNKGLYGSHTSQRAFTAPPLFCRCARTCRVSVMKSLRCG